jgi:O-antigen ligase
MSLSAERSSARAAVGVDWRSIAFVAVLLLTWLTLKPFGDLADPETLDLSSGREATTYLCFAALAALCLAQVAGTDRQGLRCLAVPSFIGLAGWIGVTCLTSQDSVTSLKRAALCAFVAIAAASLPLLPRGRFHLAALLALAAGIVVGLSYFGVIFMPQYAVHQASDIVEPGLAGDWRGVFGHKNAASAIFSMIAFIGIFVARSGRPAQGALLCGLALLFVFLSGGKSSTVLCSAAILISLLATRVRFGFAGAAAFVVTPLLALNALGVGAAALPSLASISASLPLDATFTGRTDIWRFALGEIPGRLSLGYGFSAFWNSEAARVAAADAASWAGEAAHAHNGYLDAVLAMGLPGLAFVLWAFLIQPLADLRRAARAGADPALLLMLAQIWLFGVYLSSLESFFFDRNDPIWMTFLFAIFGLRYVACYKTAAR